MKMEQMIISYTTFVQLKKTMHRDLYIWNLPKKRVLKKKKNANATKMGTARSRRLSVYVWPRFALELKSIPANYSVHHPLLNQIRQVGNTGTKHSSWSAQKIAIKSIKKSGTAFKECHYGEKWARPGPQNFVYNGKIIRLRARKPKMGRKSEKKFLSASARISWRKEKRQGPALLSTDLVNIGLLRRRKTFTRHGPD